MTNNSELHRLSLALVLLDKLAAKHPQMTLATALEAQRSMLTLAMTEPRSDGTLDQAAAAIYADLDERGLLPPWN